ncbi:class I SAM-dependent methyltransferase [Actinacidiphila acidipaludis]|uniref:Class I SAM-dependent methyltransferase n=1 Tax=Actinacidiphila acidipaludis TaxID=2873382 RepID=A0ABS7Q1K4_9ACTN|nr:class I SAM-dependent methyltransferase [Streptomyces acidipaludis]MBY8876330.1 class I SAM-dependent methyltransferase [Streptomyces acidipaludis]
MTPSAAADAADPWNTYGRSRASDDRARGTSGRLFWDWYQRIGPGAEILGDVAGKNVADLGCGNGRQAAHVAEVLGAARVVAIDASPGQIARGRDLYGHVGALHFVHADASTALQAAPDSLDVAYSYFGAPDFTDPRDLLPVVARSLHSGGMFVMATLAHYTIGRPAETEVRPGTIRVRHDNGTTSSMDRWVLDALVWERLLGEAGFTGLALDVLRDPGFDKRPPMATLLIRGTRG